MKNYGLVISGGGRNGAFAVGALYRLTSQFKLRFKIISGTSTGALIAGPAITDNISILNDIYRGGVTNDDIIKKKNFISAFFSGSLNDTAPLKNLINKYTDINALTEAWNNGYKAVVTVTNMRTGQSIKYWSNPDGLYKWKDYVLASASIPVLMEPVNIDGDLYADGGLVDIVPINPILDYNEIDEIFVIINSPLETSILPENPSGIVGTLSRIIDIMTSEIAKNDLPKICEHTNKKLHLIYPDRYLGDALDFNPKEMEKIWLEGFEKVGKLYGETTTSL